MKPGRRGRGRPLVRVFQRALVLTASATLIVVGFSVSAKAQTGACTTGTNYAPGQAITVSGSGAAPGEDLRLRFGPALTPISLVVVADAAGFFSVTGTIPAGATPGDYPIQVQFPGGPGANFIACIARVSAAAVPTPTPTPTAAPADDDDDDGGGGGDDDGGPTQEQRQEQSINFPVALPIPHFTSGGGGGGGRSLPKTGTDIAEVGGIGTASLVAGVTLMEFARRRRRHWLAPAAPTVASRAQTPSAPAAVEELPMRAGETEADLLLPYSPIASSPPPEDFVAPSF